MAWGKEWPSISLKEIIEYKPTDLVTKDDVAGGPVFIGVDLGKDDQTTTVIGKWDLGKNLIIEKILNNKMPTHDPYANPNAQIYYQCACGTILDPGTKSFAQLNNCASDAGWKIRFREIGYVPYCVKCGEGVE